MLQGQWHLLIGPLCCDKASRHVPMLHASAPSTGMLLGAASRNNNSSMMPANISCLCARTNFVAWRSFCSSCFTASCKSSVSYSTQGCALSACDLDANKLTDSCCSHKEDWDCLLQEILHGCRTIVEDYRVCHASLQPRQLIMCKL